MAYLNINNYNNTINEDPENCKYLMTIPKQWNYNGTFTSFMQKHSSPKSNAVSELPKDIRYKSFPLLYQHRQNLEHLWNNFEAFSLITNRGCLKQLATMNISNNVKNCTFKLFKARDSKTGAILDNYILELGNFVDERILENYQQQYLVGACVAGMLTKNGKFSPQFNTYKPANFKLNFNNYGRTSSCPINIGTSENGMPNFTQSKESIKVYYTSEIDAFMKEGYGNKAKYVPVEIKAKYDVNNNMDISPKKAFLTALQCQLAGVTDIVIGFHDGKRIQSVKHYSLQNLKDIAQGNEKFKELLNVDKAIQEAKFLLKEIINKFDEKVSNGSMDIRDTLVIVKRLEMKEHRIEQKYCLDYFVKEMCKKDGRRRTCEF